MVMRWLLVFAVLTTGGLYALTRPQEADLRRTLTQIVSDAAWAGDEASRRRTLSLFSEGLRRFDVQAVCMAKNGASGHLRRILAASRFRREHDGRRYEIWVRS